MGQRRSRRHEAPPSLSEPAGPRPLSLTTRRNRTRTSPSSSTPTATPSPRGWWSLSTPLPASENGRSLPALLRSPLGAQADAIRAAALSLDTHRGTTVVGEMGTGKDLHRGLRRPHGRLPPGARALPSAPHPQMEARGRGDRARRARHHRRLHHRPREAAPLPRTRAALRGHVAGTRGSSRSAGCPPSPSAGRPSTAGSCGMRKRWSRSGYLAARTASRRSSTRTGCP